MKYWTYLASAIEISFSKYLYTHLIKSLHTLSSRVLFVAKYKVVARIVWNVDATSSN